MEQKITYEQSVFNRLKSLSVNEEIKFDKSKGSVADWNKFLESVRLFYSADFWFEVSHNSVKKVAKETKEQAQKSADNESWTEEINSLQEFFSSIELPKGEIQFNRYTKIIDVEEFVSGHLSFCRNNNGKRIYIGYLERLREMRDLLSAEICEKTNK